MLKKPLTTKQKVILGGSTLIALAVAFTPQPEEPVQAIASTTTTTAEVPVTLPNTFPPTTEWQPSGLEVIWSQLDRHGIDHFDNFTDAEMTQFAIITCKLMELYPGDPNGLVFAFSNAIGIDPDQGAIAAGTIGGATCPEATRRVYE